LLAQNAATRLNRSPAWNAPSVSVSSDQRTFPATCPTQRRSRSHFPSREPDRDRPAHPRSFELGRRPGGKSLDVLGAERLAAYAPVAAFHLFDEDPGDVPHVLSLDRDHRVGEALDDLSLLLGGEDVFDQLH